MADEDVLLEISVTTEEAAALARWHGTPLPTANWTLGGVDVVGLVERLAEAAAS